MLNTHKSRHTHTHKQRWDKREKRQRRRRVLSSLLDNLTLLWPAFLIPLLCCSASPSWRPSSTLDTPARPYSGFTVEEIQITDKPKGCKKAEQEMPKGEKFKRNLSHLHGVPTRRTFVPNSKKNHRTNAFQRKNFNQNERTYEWKAKPNKWK